MASIPALLHIVGELRSEDDLVIDGDVKGHVHVPLGTVTIAIRARVDADIHAKRIDIHGSVRGTLSATERIDIAASASVTGHVSADHVVIVEGALVNAHVDMNRRTIASRVAQYHATDASNTSRTGKS